MLILAHVSACSKIFIFRLRLCLSLFKHKGPQTSFLAIIFVNFLVTFVLLYDLNWPNFSTRQSLLPKLSRKTHFSIHASALDEVTKFTAQNSKNILDIPFKMEFLVSLKMHLHLGCNME